MTPFMLHMSVLLMARPLSGSLCFVLGVLGSKACETCRQVQRQRRVQDYRRKASNDSRCWLYILKCFKKNQQPKLWYKPDSGLCELFHPHPAVLTDYQFKYSSLEPMTVKYHSNPPSVHAKETDCHHCCILNLRIIAGSWGSDIIFVSRYCCW